MKQFCMAVAALGAGALASAATAQSPPLPVQAFIDLCLSSGFDEAVAKGDALGWPREASSSTYRSAVASFLKGPFRDVTWAAKDRAASLTYLREQRQDGFWACSYWGKTAPAGLIEALSKKFGKPVSQTGTADDGQFIWRQGDVEVSMARDARQALIDFKPIGR